MNDWLGNPPCPTAMCCASVYGHIQTQCIVRTQTGISFDCLEEEGAKALLASATAVISAIYMMI